MKNGNAQKLPTEVFEALEGLMIYASDNIWQDAKNATDEEMEKDAAERSECLKIVCKHFGIEIE